MNNLINQKTILIFAYECSPYHLHTSTIGAQRPAQFAKYLPAFNWRVIVLCCDSRKRRVFDRNDIKSIEYIVKQYFPNPHQSESIIIPIPSLKYDGIIDRLWSWLNAKNSHVFNFLRKILTFVKFFKGDYSQSWQPCARLAADLIAKKTKIDCCLGEHSPDAGLFLAKWYAKKYNVPWIADFRDPILQSYSKFLRLLFSPFVKKMFKSASVIVNVNPYWSGLDKQLFNRPVRTVTNGFDPCEFDSNTKMEQETVFVGYFGNFNKMDIINEYTGLHIFLKGLAQFIDRNNNLKNKIKFIYRGRDSHKVNFLVKKNNVENSVEAASAVTRCETLRLMQKCHALLLVSVSPHVNDELLKQGFYPGKVFEYFGALRPILCIPGDKGMLEELVLRTNTGVILNSSDQVEKFLKLLSGEWFQKRQLLYSPNKNQVGRYTRRFQTKLLAAILDEAVSNSRN